MCFVFAATLVCPGVVLISFITISSSSSSSVMSVVLVVLLSVSVLIIRTNISVISSRMNNNSSTSSNTNNNNNNNNIKHITIMITTRSTISIMIINADNKTITVNNTTPQW